MQKVPTATQVSWTEMLAGRQAVAEPLPRGGGKGVFCCLWTGSFAQDSLLCRRVQKRPKEGEFSDCDT